MQPLISIETVPISIKYSQTPPALIAKDPVPEVKATEKELLKNEVKSPAKNISTKLPTVTRPMKTRSDSYVHGNTTGVYNLTYTATPRYDDEGKLSFNIKMDGGSDVFSIKKFGRDIQNMIGHILGNDQNIKNDFEHMELSIDFNDLQKNMVGSGKTGKTFTFPSFEVEILEMPKVIVKYEGGPIYIPKSADPNYEPPEE
jgi:hypothetical protein